MNLDLMLTPWPPLPDDLQGVVPDDAISRYDADIRKAVLIRRTEQRLLKLFGEGKLFGTVHTCIGQEFVGVSVARSLQPQDALFSNHRGHGHFLAYGGDVAGLIAEVMGKATGVCGGRGGSQHLHQRNYYSNGIQGGIAPVGAGLAYAAKIRGDRGIVVVFLGDGTLGQGAVYESMNIASRWGLPLLLVCENNLFAQSTCQTETLAGDICQRARAFDIETFHVDTWDWPRLFQQMQSAVELVREDQRPAFIRVDTFRLMPHSKGDDNRPAEYIDAYWRRDPLALIEAAYESDPRWTQMVEEIDAEIEDAVVRAEAAEYAAWKASDEPSPKPVEWTGHRFPRERCVQSVRRALGEALQRDERLLVYGEDVESPYGGAFKCTMGLSADFPGRVHNAPISEAALVGIANGLALGGLVPVVEIMFGDFLTLAADQWINHAAKFRFMFDDKVQVPMVVRTPMGGKRGYAATHSQSLEKHFLGLPGTQVLCLHHRFSPAELYARLLATIDRPTLVVENKLLYGKYCDSDPPGGFELLCSPDDFPVVRLKPRVEPEVTLVAVGGMGIDAEQAMIAAFVEHEIVVDLFLPSRLYPFDVGCLEESLRQTRRLLVAEEGQGFVSFSSELISQAAERWGAGGIACRRVTAAAAPIPASRPLEERCLPGAADILAAIVGLRREHVH
jgi:2-oxoisovalerate dehydrogenase E1 component